MLPPGYWYCPGRCFDCSLVIHGMNGTYKRFLWLSAYAIAMAFLEAALVVYIRGLLHVTDGHVPLTSLGPYTRVEIWRQVATIVMLVAGILIVAQLRTQRRLRVVAYSHDEQATLLSELVDANRRLRTEIESLTSQQAAYETDNRGAVMEDLVNEGNVGLMNAVDVFVAPLKEAVWRRLPGCSIQRPELPPALGACLLGLGLLDIPVGQPTIAAMHDGAKLLEGGGQ